MPKYLDLECSQCGAEVDDMFVRQVPPLIIHLECGGTMEQVYRLRSRYRNAQWSDKDAVVVFRDAQGKYRYPATNTAATPKGYERVELRSLREVETFERHAGVRSEMAWFDKGSGRGHDSETPGPKPVESEDKRFERFRRATQGVL